MLLSKKTVWTKRLAGVSVIILLAVAAITVQYFRLPERAWFHFRIWQNAAEWRAGALWLPDYQVEIEAKPIAGISRNISALTWNKDSRTLFSVVNSPPEIVELSTAGELLRRIPVRGLNDTEAIEYIGDNRFIIADERKQKLVKIIVDASTTEIDVALAQHITLGIGLSGNKGIEGLAWDWQNERLYAAKEKNPISIFVITGFPQKADQPLSLEIGRDALRDSRLFLKDVSSLDFNNHYGHLLVLSDESKLILEVSSDGRPISSLSLQRGQHGLKRSIPQAEGMAIDDHDTLYLVSEPNLFYAFKKRSDDATRH